MSYSTMYFDMKRFNRMEVATLEFDTNDLFKELDGDFSIFFDYGIDIDNIKVAYSSDSSDSFIKQIVLVNYHFMTAGCCDTRAFISYCHSSDLSLYKVILECGKILNNIQDGALIEIVMDNNSLK